MVGGGKLVKTFEEIKNNPKLEILRTGIDG